MSKPEKKVTILFVTYADLLKVVVVTIVLTVSAMKVLQ